MSDYVDGERDSLKRIRRFFRGGKFKLRLTSHMRASLEDPFLLANSKWSTQNNAMELKQ